MYAIIATGGKQYKVAEGDIIRVEKLGAEAGETVTFDDVLAVSNDGLKVGADVANASVTASVIEHGKAKKVVIYKYKRKTGYHNKNGHRQQFTKVKIEKING
ncbi:MAG: 50S ribosomal protein L21 [Ruminococcus sp.]